MAKKGKRGGKGSGKKKGGRKSQAASDADAKPLTEEELKAVELRNLYWQEMHRQAIFLDMTHTISRPWVTSYYQVIPRLTYGIPIGPKEEGGGKGKKKKGKKK